MEIVVSIGLVAVITLFVVGVLTRMLMVGGKTAHQTAGNLLAEQIVEDAAIEGPPAWGFDTSSRDGTRRLLLPGDKTETPFYYHLEVVPLRASSEDLGKFYSLKVTVRWGNGTGNPGEQAYSPGLGKAYTEAFRKVYVRD